MVNMSGERNSLASILLVVDDQCKKQHPQQAYRSLVVCTLYVMVSHWGELVCSKLSQADRPCSFCWESWEVGQLGSYRMGLGGGGRGWLVASSPISYHRRRDWKERVEAPVVWSWFWCLIYRTIYFNTWFSTL